MDFLDLNVTSTEKLPNCKKVNFTGPDGPGMERFTDVHLGLAWSTSKSPMFAVVIGELVPDKYLEDREPMFELLYEKEIPGIDIEKKFDTLGDICHLFGKCEMWASFADKFEALKESFWSYESRKRQPGGLQPAPYEHDFRTGLEICKSLLNRNRLRLSKKSVVFNQLAEFVETDLSLHDVAQKYFAIEALRNCIASYIRYPPVRKTKSERLSTGAGNPQGWML